MAEQTYEGWKNWETWNVALHIANNEGLYNEARNWPHGYVAFARMLRARRHRMGGAVMKRITDSHLLKLASSIVEICAPGKELDPLRQALVAASAEIIRGEMEERARD